MTCTPATTDLRTSRPVEPSRSARASAAGTTRGSRMPCSHVCVVELSAVAESTVHPRSLWGAESATEYCHGLRPAAERRRQTRAPVARSAASCRAPCTPRLSRMSSAARSTTSEGRCSNRSPTTQSASLRDTVAAPRPYFPCLSPSVASKINGEHDSHFSSDSEALNWLQMHLSSSAAA